MEPVELSKQKNKMNNIGWEHFSITKILILPTETRKYCMNLAIWGGM